MIGYNWPGRSQWYAINQLVVQTYNHQQTITWQASVCLVCKHVPKKNNLYVTCCKYICIYIYIYIRVCVFLIHISQSAKPKTSIPSKTLPTISKVYCMSLSQGNNQPQLKLIINPKRDKNKPKTTKQWKESKPDKHGNGKQSEVQRIGLTAEWYLYDALSFDSCLICLCIFQLWINKYIYIY